MALPDTYASFRRTTGDLPLTIEPSTEKMPQNLAPTEVLIQIHAVSLNFRDVAMLHGRYIAPVVERSIVASDCAAEVVKVGSNVKSFQIGDRVSPNFLTNFLTGDEEDRLLSLGGEIDGVLRKYAVFDERVLVKVPGYLSWDEASTIACAGVTAWNALNRLGSLGEKDTVLLEGTGGVSMFALLLLTAAGIKTIITSSSDEKLESVKKLSPLTQGINYKAQTDIAAEVKRLTNGRGAKIIINNAGVPTIPSNISSLAMDGTISIVGFLGGFEADWNPGVIMGLMGKRGKLQGIIVGSKRDFETLNRFLDEKKVRLDPLINSTKFAFEDSKEAFDYLYSGSHIGKVIIQL